MKTTLRDYQAKGFKKFKALYDTNESFKGRFVYPTGSGKTVLESHILNHIINDEGDDLHLVLAPRIVLVNQLANDFSKQIGNDCHYAIFHSGDEPDLEVVDWCDVKTTTKLDVIEGEILRAREMYNHPKGQDNPDLVIFSTYHSAKKLTGLKFDTLIADESQYCIQENFFDVINELKAKVKLFFTATERVNKHGAQRSNDNEDVFGEIIHRVSPSFLIKEGWIVAPKLHAMHCQSNMKFDSSIDQIVRFAKKQNELVKKNGMPCSKTLFACRGTEPVKIVNENIDRIQAEIDHNIYTILSHKDHGARINGEPVSRQDFMARLKDDKCALIFHYDILSEGIDISGITGVVIMRGMEQAKLMQTIGRALRLHFIDDINVKKNAYVSVPVVNGDDQNRAFVYNVVNGIRSGGYEITEDDIEFTDHIEPGVDEENPLEDHAVLEEWKKAQTLVHDVIHEVEKDWYYETLMKMDEDEWLSEIS